MITRSRTLALALLLAGGTAQAELASSTIELEGVEHVYLLSRHNLVVTQGEKEFVTVTAEREHLDEVEARIKGDVLALGEERSSFWSWAGPDRDWEAKIEVQLRNPRSITNRSSGSVSVGPVNGSDDFALVNQGSGSMQSAALSADKIDLRLDGSGASQVELVRTRDLVVRVQGSGDLDVRQAAADAVKVAIQGSGQVDIRSGRTTELEVSINGSGDLDSADFLSERVAVKINGSGDVMVHAAEELSARINGSGDVRYTGEPKRVEEKVNGSGDVEPRK